MTENGKYHERVELIPEEWVYVRFNYPTPKTGKTDDGRAWFLYGVDQYDSKNKLWTPRTFFPSNLVQQILKDLKIIKGTQIGIMQRASIDPKTKKPFTYYEILHNKQTYSTKELREAIDNAPPEGESKEVIHNEHVSPEISSPESKEPYPEAVIPDLTFYDIATEIWNTVETWIAKDLTDVGYEQKAQARCKVVEISTTMVNTAMMELSRKGKEIKWS
jgi:hypothetical protein